MAFLQELRTGINVVIMEIDDLNRQGGDLTTANAKYSALMEIWGWVKSGSWSPRSDFVHRILVLITKDRDAAISELGLTDINHANTLLYRANATLEKTIGTDIINSILSGDVHEAMTKFRLKTGTTLSDTLFLSDLKAVLPEPASGNRYKLGDCTTEAKFLAFYSRAVLEKRFGSLDKDKLAYLVYLLNTYDPSLLCESAALSRVVTGDASIESLKTVTNPTNSVYT